MKLERKENILKKSLLRTILFSMVSFFVFSFSGHAYAAYPVITGITTSNLTAQGVTVEWTTNIPSNSLVDFGATTAYGTTLGDTNELVTDHSVALTGLSPLTKYYFQVRSKDVVGNETINNNSGSGFTFTTTSAPIISQVRLESVTDNQAIVTFRTDIPSYPWIAYGLTDAYGTVVGDEENFGTNHRVIIYGLTPGRQYYYKPRVTDMYGNYTFFQDNNFFTTSGPYLQSISTTANNGTYGPGSQIAIVATYQEPVVNGSSSIAITLNTGVQLELNQVNNNTISGLYVVGTTGSGQNVSSLFVESVTSQNVCDNDGFCYRGTTLPSENINETKTVTVDTTAPVFSNVAPIDQWPMAFNSIRVNSDISYTLSEALQSGAISFLRTGGTADPNAPHTCNLKSAELTFGSHNNFNMTNCTQGAPVLVDGATYSIRFEGVDLYGNNATRFDTASMRYDVSTPLLQSFSSSTPNGTYGAGSQITLIAGFNEGSSGTMRVILDTGVEVTLTYNSTEGVVKGTYTVGDISSGQYSEDLTVVQISYMSMTDWAGNTITSTDMSSISGNNLGDTSQIKIDTEAADAPSLVQFMTSPINIANRSNVTLRIEGEIGTTIHYIINDTNGSTAPISGSVLMEGDGSTDVTGVNLASLSDGTITAQAQLEKQNGEFSSFAQGIVIKDTDLPGWYMQYYRDSNFTQSLGDNPRLSPGTYYIRITFSDGEALNESISPPNMLIDAEGSLNDVLSTPIQKISSTVYSFTRTIVYDSNAIGSILENLYLDSMMDAYGNSAINVNPHYENIKASYADTIKPTVTGTVSPDYAKAGVVNVSLIFDEQIKQNISPLVRLRKNNGTYTTVSGSFGSTTTWNGSVELFSGDSNGSADLQVSLAQDRAGNSMDVNEDVYNFFIDTQNPMIFINLGTDIGPVKTDTINLSVSDASGSGIVTRSYGFSSDTICNSGDVYDFSFSDGVSFNIEGNETRHLCSRAFDRAGNTAYQYIGKLNTDNTNPTIKSVTSNTTNGSYKAGDTIDIEINFSEVITTIGSVDIVLETGAIDRGCSMSAFESNKASCDYIVQEEDISADLNQIAITGIIQDLAENILTQYTPQSSLAANKNIIVDTTPPRIEIISPLQGNPVSGSTVVFFTNNEPTLSQCSFDGSTWTSCATGATSLGFIGGWDGLPEGTINLFVRDTDLAGNIGMDSELGLLKDTNFPVVSDVDSAPSIPSGYYKSGAQIPLIITFSRPVTSTGNVIVTLETGSVDRSCEFSINNGTEGTCTYTVQDGDTSGDLNVMSVSGTIKDSTGNNLFSPVPVVNLADNKDIRIDTTRPTVSSVNSTLANGTYGVGSVIDVSVTFSEAVTSGQVIVNFDSGGSCSLSFSDTTVSSCIYTVLSGQNTLDLTVNQIAGTILDRAGNSVSNFVPLANLGSNKNIKIDTTPSGPPIIQSVTSEVDDISYTIGATIPVTVNFSETIIVSGPVTVTFETGSIDRTCSIQAADINQKLAGTCIYTVREGDTSPDLSVKSVSGSIYDIVNNQLTNTVPITNLNDLKNIIIDTTAPNPPVFSLTDPITDINKTNISLSGSGEENAQILFSIDDANPLTPAKTGAGNVSSLGIISIGTIDITGLDGGMITTSMTLTDSAGNRNAPGNATATSQVILPIITSITSNKENGFYPLGETIDIRVHFSENVTSTGDVTVVLETGVIDRSCAFTLNGSNEGVCNYTIQEGDTTNDLNVKFVSGEIHDQADNPMINFGISSNLSENKDIAIDTVAPPTPVVFLMDPITDGNKSNVLISGTGEANTSFSYTIDDTNEVTTRLQGTGTVDSSGVISFSVDVTNLDGGILTLSVIITDSAGNSSNPGIDTATSEIVLPTIISIESEKADGYYKADEDIDIRVHFSENVTSTGDVTVVLETGDADGSCSFSINDSSMGMCNYKVLAGHNTEKLQVISISGDIHDQSNNPMLQFTPQTNLAQTKNIVIDTINVTLLAFSSSTPDGIYGPNSAIEIITQYSEPLRSGSEIRVFLDTSVSLVLNTISSENNTQLIGTYRTGGPGSGEGTSDLRVGSIQTQNTCDLAGNCLTNSTLPPTNIYTYSDIAIDTVSPVFSNISPENSTNLESITDNSDISYTLSEDLTQGTITITRTAWNEDPQSPHVCVLEGENLKAGLHENFNTTLCASGAITLTTGTVYSIAFNGVDVQGNPAREVLQTGISYGLDTTPPIISSVSVEEITSVSAKVSWLTDEPANSFVDFGMNGNLVNLRGDSSVLSQNHSVTLDGLSPGTLYTFQVRSFDGTLNEAIDNKNGEGYVFETLNLPSIVNTEVKNITYQSVEIVWEVDSEVYSYLSYGETDSYGKAVGDESNLKNKQSVVIEGLHENKTYHYRIKMRDVYGNLSLSEDYTFATPIDPTDKEAPIISTISISNLTSKGVKISWNTDEPSDSYVEYGKTEEFGEIYGSGTLVQEHSITLPSLLEPTTVYYFRVISADANRNKSFSTIDAFLTLSPEKDGTATGSGKDQGKETGSGQKGDLDLGDPSEEVLLSDIKVSNNTSSSVTITFDTNKPTNGVVKYGISEEYGSSVAENISLETKEDFSTRHEIIIYGLLSNIIYHYKIVAYDAFGNIGISRDATFETQILSSVSGVSVSNITLSTATITWETSEPTTSEIDYGKTTAYGEIFNSGKNVSNYHKIELTGLNTGQEYNFRIRGLREDDSVVASDNYVFATYPEPKVLGYSTEKISNSSVTVNWTTNIPTESSVSYESVNNSDDNGIQGIFGAAQEHAVEVLGLKQGTEYKLKIKGIDINKNIFESEAFVVKTNIDTIPPEISFISSKTSMVSQSEEIIQVIISWRTNEPATTQIFFDVGMGEGVLGQQSRKDENLTTNHVVVLTDLRPGSVYRFNAVSEDINSNTSTSDMFSFLTPQKEMSVFQLIVANFEETFGWIRK